MDSLLAQSNRDKDVAVVFVVTSSSPAAFLFSFFLCLFQQFIEIPSGKMFPARSHS